ncbi:MAG: DNA topoisomerase IB [Actinomycetota bacterium]
MAVTAKQIEAIVQDGDDPQEAARAAGLRHVGDRGPGIGRKRAGKGFTYSDPDGRKLADMETLRRIRSLAVPPAWTDVWICPDPRGHIQATGRDARGRKQYRYHPRWREVRDETKYGRMVAFGDALPTIRQRVSADLSKQGLPKEKVVATVVRLLEDTLIRVGNEEYAKENRSYGLTTMRDQHVKVRGAKVRFEFVAKGGQRRMIDLQDARLARIVRKCRDLPGQDLFQYVDGDGEVRSVGSEDVNDYLREISGQEFTAKDFRTWTGTVLAALALCELEPFGSQRQAKKNVLRAIEQVAETLGNTPAVCRKCYVHPQVIGAYLDGTPILISKGRTSPRRKGLSAEERTVLRFLKKRLASSGSRSESMEQTLRRSVKAVR